VKLSKDRFFSGVNDNLEVVAAQTSLSTARNLYVRALAKYNVARIKLAVALGVIQGFQL
jgi:outer membrane protein